MRISSALVTLALSSVVAARSIWPGGLTEQTTPRIQGDLSVPGENPLEFCRDTGEDILTIERVNLTPNPPLPGQTLTIEAAGVFSEDIEEGAYVNLQVKYGLIRLINQRADLCEQIKNVDLECPIKKGKTVLTKEVELPKEIPPGKYTVFADVYTVDDRKITCLTATVVFPR
ncbi:putative phosphatidylglycerol/phosphatidylinositol transfer protein [Xylona heveae TC161]|uniref:Phosphatidylglycerol/phosphatidylinositol transfer protein n=1 Tax=Xylona heveae (strain CBS 132557 / TC161) TaxID=1328760 RepID=A0A165IUR8_XYLHT|nr:putative phosphatidylglycerol/phosphatidylinositol transfer protein [Xylona heveae TC161]KZF25418.1 putative phosphatidylglycerol/phosphatidylinositol transfer protein [Xylona heveae TC161]